MQINGTITNIVPSGSYQSKGGQVFTFQMGIQTQQGAYAGEIGSKSQEYPLAVGQPIMVTVTESPQGTKFKKVNPQYAQQDAQQQQAPPQAPPQGQQAPPVQQQAPATTAPSRNQSIERQCAVKAACILLAGSGADAEAVVFAAERFTYFFESGKAMLRCSIAYATPQNNRKKQEKPCPNQNQNDSFSFCRCYHVASL